MAPDGTDRSSHGEHPQKAMDVFERCGLVLTGICLAMIAVISWTTYTAPLWMMSVEARVGVLLIMTGSLMALPFLLEYTKDRRFWCAATPIVFLAGMWLIDTDNKYTFIFNIVVVLLIALWVGIDVLGWIRCFCLICFDIVGMLFLLVLFMVFVALAVRTCSA